MWSELPDDKLGYKNLNQMGSGNISLKDGIYNPTHYMGSMINDMEGGSDMRGLRRLCCDIQFKCYDTSDLGLDVLNVRGR